METGHVVSLPDDSLHYVRRVLRMGLGDRLDLMDGQGWQYEGRICSLSSTDILVEIMGKSFLPDSSLGITLCQALIKANKMDFIIQRSVELGITRFIPFSSSRTIVHLTPASAAVKVKRWQKIASESARQCGRSIIPAVAPLMSYQEMLKAGGAKAAKIIFWEGEMDRSIGQLFRGEEKESPDYFFVIGPEGGFSGDEIARAGGEGFLPVSIGKRVLKVETAVLSILAILQYERGIFHAD
jgi:16S rRNA (uracil1498-N3)-methyltransferase